jgi:hypothetical protein
MGGRVKPGHGQTPPFLAAGSLSDIRPDALSRNSHSVFTGFLPQVKIFAASGVAFAALARREG